MRRDTPDRSEVQSNLRAALDNEDSGSWWAALKPIDDFDDDALVDLLKEGLKSPNRAIRSVTPRFVVLANRPSLAEDLMASASQFDDRSSVGALSALGKLGNANDEVVDFLFRRLQHRLHNMRTNAVEALGNLRISSAVQDLSAAANDRRAGVRIAAIEALARIGTADAVDALSVIASESRRWLTASSAVRRLEGLPDGELRRSALDFVLNHGGRGARKRARRALVREKQKF